jgi:anti-sigma regulatory factor (Ser/Thr protein kinase)
VDTLLAELARFTGTGWVQEDDITLVTLECRSRSPETSAQQAPIDHNAPETDPHAWQPLADFTIASAPDNERHAMEQVAAAVTAIELPPLRLERLKTAVAEATMNAMEHGNEYRTDQPVQISVRRSASALSVQIFDRGRGRSEAAETPDLLAKLEGLQTPRGWGLHLIRHMVDELHESQEDGRHVVELIVRLYPTPGAHGL